MSRQQKRQLVSSMKPVIELLEARTLMSAVPMDITEVTTPAGVQLQVNGTAGNDQINITANNDSLLVSNGTGWSAAYSGPYASILIDGGAGDDVISIDPSVSTDALLYGGAGNDTLTGGAGNDRLYGGAGTNILSGGAGNDTLISVGGSTADILTGGAGRDSFWCDAAGTEKVTDITSDETSSGDLHRVGSFLGTQAASAPDSTISASATPDQGVGATNKGKHHHIPQPKPVKPSRKHKNQKNKKGDYNIPYPIAPVPVDPTPAPVDPMPAPVDPTPAPVDPTPTVAPDAPTTTTITPSLVINPAPVTTPDLLTQNTPVNPLITAAATGYHNFNDRPLFASTGPSANDIQQGQIGDCYFLSVLSSVAKVDAWRVQETITDLGDGSYAVRFAKNGNAAYVRVSGELPTTRYGDLAYANFGAQGSLWVALVEKAFAVFRTSGHSYAATDSGWMDESYTALGVSSRGTYSAASGTALLTLIGNELNAGKSVTYGLGTAPAGSGLVGGHAYMVDSIVRDSSGSAIGLRLRNPWAIDGYYSTDGVNDGYVTLTGTQALGAMLGFVSAVV